ncbi:unnamed protein product, partial [marine sediment metagenome]
TGQIANELDITTTRPSSKSVAGSGLKIRPTALTS